MLTLEEIENISFRKAGIGGYKPDDVDNFVDSVIVKVKELELANKELETRIGQLNSKVLKYEENAHSVQDAIITAEATAKKIVSEAQEKADTILKEAQDKADLTVSDADAQAEKTLLESSTKAETVLNNVLSKSAHSVDENNRIIEEQKQQIKKIQDEVTQFKINLIEVYKEHLKILDSLSDSEEFEQYRKKLEKTYPQIAPNTPKKVEKEVEQYAQEAAVEASKLLAEKKQSQPSVSVKENEKKSAEKNNTKSAEQPDEKKKVEMKAETKTKSKTEQETHHSATSEKSSDTEHVKATKQEEPKPKSKGIDISRSGEIKIDINDLKSEIKKVKEKMVGESNQSEEPQDTDIEFDDSEIEDDGVIFSSASVEKEFKSSNSTKYGVLKLDDID